MGKIFKVDGTEEWFDEVYDEQEELKNAISSFESHLSVSYDNLRAYRNNELLASDWTQGEDSPFASDKKALWKSYRTKLRDLPESAKAPMWFEESDWPLAPGESSIPDAALRFLKSNADPIGIGTTSWVGITTGMVKKGSITDCVVRIGTDTVGVADTSGVEVGDTLKTEGVTISIVTGITTTSVSLASSSTVEVVGDLDYFREGNVYFKQTRPCAQITFDANSKVGGISTDIAVIGTHNTFDFEVNITDMANTDSYEYEISSSPEHSFINNKGVVSVVPDSNFVGTALVPVSISGAAGTVTSPTNIEFSYTAYGKEYKTFVGVVTT